MNEIAFIDAFEPVISEGARVASAFFSSGSIDEDRTEDIDAFEPVISERTRVGSAFTGSASIDEDRTEFRRWWFSAMLVVALHAAVGIVVLTWHITSKVLDPDAAPRGSPFFIDLAPLPAVRSLDQSLAERETGLDGSAAPLERANNAEGSAVNRDAGTESARLQPNEAEPGAKELNAGTGASAVASHAFAIGHTEESHPVDASHALRVDPGPIDASITVLPPALRQHKAFGAFDRNRVILLRPLTHPGMAAPSRDNRSAPANAPGADSVSGHGSLGYRPGAHIQDRVNAAIERGELLRRIERARNGNPVPVPGTNSLGVRNATGTAAHDNAKNAIGVATPNSGVGSPKAGVVNGMARNAIGAVTEVHPSAHGPGVNERREGVAGVARTIGLTGVSPSSAGLKIGAPPPGILNGRGMARPGTSLTALGGPPNNVPAVLNGSDFHPKLGTRYGP